jgi:hypothetical protein
LTWAARSFSMGEAISDLGLQVSILPETIPGELLTIPMPHGHRAILAPAPIAGGNLANPKARSMAGRLSVHFWTRLNVSSGSEIERHHVVR